MRHFLVRLLLLVVSLLSMELSVSADVIYTVKFQPSDFLLENMDDGSTFISTDSRKCFYGEGGQPCLPLMSYSYALPYGSKVKSVTFSESEECLLAKDITLYLNPKEMLMHNGKVEIIEPSSSESSSAMNKYTSTSSWHGMPMANLQLCPLRYDSESKKLYMVETITIDIELEPYYIPSNYQGDMSELKHEICSFVDNPEDVDKLLSQIPEQTTVNTRKLDYLIITSRELLTSFVPLLEWKRKKGLIPYIISVEEIALRYEGEDIQEKIKHCIYDAYLSYGLQYVVLGGDDTVVPVRYCQSNKRTVEEYEAALFPTDMYYTYFDEEFTWDRNGDNIFGREDDDITPVSQVYLTRIPVRTEEHVSNYICKLIGYERGYNANNWDLNILMAGCQISPWNFPKNGSDAEVIADKIYDNYIHPYWNGSRVKFFDTHTDFESDMDYPLHPNELQEQLSKSPMFFSLFSHGLYPNLYLKM